MLYLVIARSDSTSEFHPFLRVEASDSEKVETIVIEYLWKLPSSSKVSTIIGQDIIDHIHVNDIMDDIRYDYDLSDEEFAHLEQLLKEKYLPDIEGEEHGVIDSDRFADILESLKATWMQNLRDEFYEFFDVSVMDSIPLI